tara:strand:+ start:85 stop:744 length:660 start_codon:yes stop_codon:yes gene_type:complete
MAHSKRSGDHQLVGGKQYFEHEAQIDSLYSNGYEVSDSSGAGFTSTVFKWGRQSMVGGVIVTELAFDFGNTTSGSNQLATSTAAKDVIGQISSASAYAVDLASLPIPLSDTGKFHRLASWTAAETSADAASGTVDGDFHFVISPVSTVAQDAAGTDVAGTTTLLDTGGSKAAGTQTEVYNAPTVTGSSAAYLYICQGGGNAGNFSAGKGTLKIETVPVI